MITILKIGKYGMIETKNKTKVLYLDNDAFAWIKPKNIGEILVSSHHAQNSDVRLSEGRYILYDVDEEDYLTDLQHLELEYGHNAWQGYLLPTGLPHDEKIRARIIPTNQLITDIESLKSHLVFNKPKLLVNIPKSAPA